MTSAFDLGKALGFDLQTSRPSPPPANSLTSTNPGKEPLAVGLLSGRFAALDPNKIKGTKAATPAAAPVVSKPVAPPAHCSCIIITSLLGRTHG